MHVVPTRLFFFQFKKNSVACVFLLWHNFLTAVAKIDHLRLQNLMKEKEYNTATLAELSGLSVSTINKIVYGIAKNPTLGNVQAITRASGFTLDELVSDDTHEPEVLTRNF